MKRRRIVVRRGLWVALGLVLASGAYAVWKRAPRHQKGLYVFVRVEPAGAFEAGMFDGYLNLPFSEFECSADRELPEWTTCARLFEGERLSVSFVGVEPTKARCRAEYAGRSYPCASALASRGSPERVLHVEGDLGLTAKRRRALRWRDPLSHASEGDWGLPIWFAGLMVAGFLGRVSHAIFRDRRAPLRFTMLTLAFLAGFPTGVVIFSLWLFFLGYID